MYRIKISILLPQWLWAKDFLHYPHLISESWWKIPGGCVTIALEKHLGTIHISAFLSFSCPEGAEMFHLYTTGVWFPYSLRTTPTPHLGQEFDGRKQQNTQMLPSKSPCVSRRPFQDPCQLFFFPGLLLTETLFYFWCFLSYWDNAEFNGSIICY